MTADLFCSTLKSTSLKSLQTGIINTTKHLSAFMQSLNHFTIPENHLSSIIVCTFILVQQTVLDVEKTHILCASVFVRGCVLSSKPTRKWVCHTTCIYVTDIININILFCLLHSPENKLNTEYLKFSIPTINAFAVYLLCFKLQMLKLTYYYL